MNSSSESLHLHKKSLCGEQWGSVAQQVVRGSQNYVTVVVVVTNCPTEAEVTQTFY